MTQLLVWDSLGIVRRKSTSCFRVLSSYITNRASYLVHRFQHTHTAYKHNTPMISPIAYIGVYCSTVASKVKSSKKSITALDLDLLHRQAAPSHTHTLSLTEIAYTGLCRDSKLLYRLFYIHANANTCVHTTHTLTHKLHLYTVYRAQWIKTSATLTVCV